MSDFCSQLEKKEVGVALLSCCPHPTQDSQRHAQSLCQVEVQFIGLSLGIWKGRDLGALR